MIDMVWNEAVVQESWVVSYREQACKVHNEVSGSIKLDFLIYLPLYKDLFDMILRYSHVIELFSRLDGLASTNKDIYFNSSET
jgi:hypothetical protein